MLTKQPKIPLEERGHWLGEWCSFCNRRNIIGFIVDDLSWNQVVGDEDAISCLTCFDEEAEKLGVKYSITYQSKTFKWFSWQK